MTEETTDKSKEAETVTATEEQNIIDDTVITSGSLARKLRVCREEADLDIEQAAQEMRLPLGVLKALEEENFTDLPEPPYVRGYLRSYARLNESDPNDLIRRYEILRGADPDDITSFTPAMPLNRTANKPTVSPGTMKFIGLAAVVLFLGILSMIPAVSQWASDTWQSFSAQTESSKAANQNVAQNNSSPENLSGSIARDGEGTTTGSTESSGDTSSENASSRDTGTVADNSSEQLALNNQENSASSTATGTSNDTSAESDNEQNASEGESATEEKQPETDSSTENSTEAATDQNNTEQSNTADTDTKAAEGDKQNTEDAQENQTAEGEEKQESGQATDEAEKDKDTEQNDESAQQAEKEAQESEEAKKAAAAEAELKKQQEEQEKKKQEEEAAKQQLAQQQEEQEKEKFQQPIDGNVHIRLDFTQSCWMSIKDSKGKNIFAALNAAGTRKELKARTPLTFKVGNSQGVRIYLNGQLVDQRPHTRGNVANFRVN